MPQFATDPDEIRRQMRDLRANLGKEAEGLVQNARVMTDWHYYLRQAPWLWIGTAAALGYFLVPSKSRYLKPTPEQLADLARSEGVVFPSKEAHSFLSTIAKTAAAALLRTGVSIAGQQLNAFVARAMAPPSSRSQPGGSVPQRQGHEP